MLRFAFTIALLLALAADADAGCRRGRRLLHRHTGGGGCASAGGCASCR